MQASASTYGWWHTAVAGSGDCCSGMLELGALLHTVPAPSHTHVAADCTLLALLLNTGLHDLCTAALSGDGVQRRRPAAAVAPPSPPAAVVSLALVCASSSAWADDVQHLTTGNPWSCHLRSTGSVLLFMHLWMVGPRPGGDPTAAAVSNTGQLNNGTADAWKGP
jgi:hypothetical protein